MSVLLTFIFQNISGIVFFFSNSIILYYWFSYKLFFFFCGPNLREGLTLSGSEAQRAVTCAATGSKFFSRSGLEIELDLGSVISEPKSDLIRNRGFEGPLKAGSRYSTAVFSSSFADDLGSNGAEEAPAIPERFPPPFSFSIFTLWHWSRLWPRHNGEAIYGHPLLIKEKKKKKHSVQDVSGIYVPFSS